MGGHAHGSGPFAHHERCRSRIEAEHDTEHNGLGLISREGRNQRDRGGGSVGLGHLIGWVKSGRRQLHQRVRREKRYRPSFLAPDMI